jgi:hypothetical protein
VNLYLAGGTVLSIELWRLGGAAAGMTGGRGGVYTVRVGCWAGFSHGGSVDQVDGALLASLGAP